MRFGKTREKNENRDAAAAMHVSVLSIFINIALSLLKLLAGVIAKSGAMISDAVHSVSDVLSTFVVIVGVKLAGKQPDSDHPYGHERMECVAAVVLAVVLAATGVGIGISGVQKIASSGSGSLEVPGVLALVAAIVSIVVKELMYQYTRRTAKKIRSGALMADAWHHRSDALSSVGSLVGVLGIDEIKTRLFGSKVYAEVEIAVDAEKTIVEAHDIAERVHSEIETNFPEVKHCMVHVNPAKADTGAESGC